MGHSVSRSRCLGEYAFGRLDSPAAFPILAPPAGHGHPHAAVAAPRDFRPPHWSLVRNAGVGTDDGRPAPETLCRTCWYALYAFGRCNGHGPDEAADLTRGFFPRFLALACVELQTSPKWLHGGTTCGDAMLLPAWRNAGASRATWVTFVTCGGKASDRPSAGSKAAMRANKRAAPDDESIGTPTPNS